MAWVVFEPTTTESRPDALTDWATRPWKPLKLKQIINNYNVNDK